MNIIIEKCERDSEMIEIWSKSEKPKLFAVVNIDLFSEEPAITELLNDGDAVVCRLMYDGIYE
jgi:hypothetical protein